jgi:hypothetical protein
LRLLGVVGSLWVAWRWLGFVVGVGRLRFFNGPARREARRTVVGRGALNVFYSIVVIYIWAFALELQLAETFVGFLAAMMMISLAIGVAATFMQPEERRPETLDVCRVTRRR